MALVDDVRAFLEAYVKGNQAGGKLPLPGIRRRRPALLGPSIEFEERAGDTELDGVDLETLGPPEANSPTGPEPAEFIDLCAMEDVVVDDDGADGFRISFVWCTDYPAQALEGSGGSKRLVPLEFGAQPGIIMAECITKLREALGDGLIDRNVTTHLVRVRFEELPKAAAQIAVGKL